VITATGVLPPDPLPPEPTAVAGSSDDAPQTAAPVTPRRVAAPRQQPRERRVESNSWGWGRQEERRPPPNQGFFGGWFGGGRW
jgi:hypothetical protein